MLDPKSNAQRKTRHLKHFADHSFSLKDNGVWRNNLNYLPHTFTNKVVNTIRFETVEIGFEGHGVSSDI